MMMYISVTRVKQLITEVLQPVLVQAKKESEYAQRVNSKLDELEKTVKETKEEVHGLGRGSKAFEELTKNFFKSQAELTNYQLLVDT